MIFSKNPNVQADIVVDGTRIERVPKFKYLGCWLTEDLDPDLEVQTRIEIARTTFMNMQKLLTNRSLNLTTRYRFVQCYIFSTLLYGVETWTMRKNIERKIQAFEFWVFRRMLRISWVDHVTNEEVLRRMGRDRELLCTIKKRKTSYLGHVYQQQI